MNSLYHTRRRKLVRAVLDSTDAMQRQWKTVLAAALDEQGISLAQFAVLKVIANDGPVTNGELSARLWVTPGAITQLVDNLIADGYIRRKPDTQDRRIHNLSLSTTGRQKLQELEHKRRHIFAKVFEALSDEELQVLLQCQAKMHERLVALQPVK